MSENVEGNIQEFSYKAEMKQLLNLIVHSLYTHPEVFLRELISNSSDALNKVRFRKVTDSNILEPEAELRIKIEIDSEKQTFSIEDSGVGMTQEELVGNIGTVAKSGTLEFFKTIQQNKQTLDGNLIGQFGVGFYSVFMVTDEVTIETRHADADSNGYRWKSKGESSYTIEEIEKPTRGTKISFTLKDDAKEFAEEYKVKSIIQKYSNFVDFPIYLGKEQVNSVTALWQKSKEKTTEEELNEFYKFVANDYQEPLAHLQLSLEGRVSFKSLLFLPKSAPMGLLHLKDEKSLQLYVNKVLIQDDCKDLLPEYLHFIKGVVDTEDLPLNVSREVAQSSPVMAKINQVLTGKVLGWLEELSKNEKTKYEQFYKEFGPLFKQGVNMDYTNRDKIIDLLRFETSKTAKGEMISLKEYIERMKDDQKEIYYLTGEDRSQIERNPNLEYFKKNAIEVLLLTEPVDVFIVPTLFEYDKKELKAIDKADLDLKQDDDKADAEKLSENLAKPLIAVFKEVLGDKVEDVIESKRLVDSPATLVAGKGAMDKQMERMMQMMNKDHIASKKILEVNMSHPLIKNLAKINMANQHDMTLRNCVMQLFEGALLLDGSLESPTEFVSRMTNLMQEATKG
ncbi:heat shock protein Hsp90 [Chloroherpeton thalassium ATCC 35110]|uniref:Chaperone protein HtpG n=1 Tax=Chloroherpeton thalassium (strain ATCC 35110 / GB-78) TaxID=517418 RepID=B3QY70_CHLT3|nr:molecular chaperone HtpG [Chloroherpeton thalassium]ACF15036.1 heat shock protein Hsp90 [Chloroherpeton thalassium ATCC 35110]